ncbi:tetratricopeptide repeat protein [Leptobacterium sp. I13]|uniref:tetratricopeptide repeat protein n=1 Tax=Leptobacterium meishanense TaxID=3128904 RepID=UPI0030ED3C6B
MHNHFIVIILLFSLINVKAQQSAIYTHNLKGFQEALDLYHSKQYQAAQNIFLKIKKRSTNIELTADCTYYIANAAIRLNQLGADKRMEEFVSQYPTSTKTTAAFMDVADYYFEQGKYAYALKWYDKVETNNISNEKEEEFNFKKGYALFTVKKYNDAKKHLNRVITSKAYGAQAKYYIGYMAYQNNDYDEATIYFDQITDEKGVNEKLSYYQADLNFKLGNFQKAIDLAKEQLPKSDRNEVSELNKIIGESYFNLQQYEASIAYLEAYKGKRGRWNNTDFYQLGYAHYKQKEYEKAIQQFNKIIDGNDHVAQNAYYHLAECYLKTYKKQEALNAFRNASEMNFNTEIQQDAWLNYARLSYDIGNPYENVSQVLTDYLKKHPKSPYKNEIEDLLVDSYITTRDYEAAIEVIENNRSTANKETLQKVTFYRGIELFTEANYKAARNYFEKSLKERSNPSYTTQAMYWMAETAYILENYEEATIGYKEFLQQSNVQEIGYKDAQYNLGYAYFKQQNYIQAIVHFEKYAEENQQDSPRIEDAYLRIGDGHFMLAQYWLAMEAYNKAIALNGTSSDYATFQKAMSHGLVGNSEQKTTTLEQFIEAYQKSPLRDDAMYELGSTYLLRSQNTEALKRFDRLINSYQKSKYVVKALLKQGLIHYNSGNNTEALIKFKKVVRAFPSTQEAIQAVSTAKLIYIDEGRVDEYANWVKELDFVEVSDAELDHATYESAEKQFNQNNTITAIKSFEAYLQKFPEGLHSLQANFYLAQAYYLDGQKEKTIPHYKYVLSKEQNEFTEQALLRVSEMYLLQKTYDEVIPILTQLEAETEYPQNVIYAQSNLMKAYYELENYEKTIIYAEKVLQHKEIDNRIKADAHVMIARAAIKTGDEAKAKEAYAEVQKSATGNLAAEALYYDAYFKNKEGAYEVSNVRIQELAKNYPGYKEYGAKGLIIMAKNFYALEDAFQATYILENVIQSFTDYPEVLEQAKNELEIIKNEEAKRNASVVPEN